MEGAAPRAWSPVAARRVILHVDQRSAVPAYEQLRQQVTATLTRRGSAVRYSPVHSVMATPRKRRPGPDDELGENAKGFPQWEHGPFTVEGEIERLGGIGRGLSTAPRWARLVARGVALIILVPIAIGLVTFVVGLFTD